MGGAGGEVRGRRGRMRVWGIINKKSYSVVEPFLKLPSATQMEEHTPAADLAGSESLGE